jgi:hypothetical protein
MNRLNRFTMMASLSPSAVPGWSRRDVWTLMVAIRGEHVDYAIGTPR